MSELKTAPPTLVQVVSVTAVTMLLFIGAGAVSGNRPGAAVLLGLEVLVAVPAMLYAAGTGRGMGRLFRFRNPAGTALVTASVIGAGLKPVFDECTVLIASVWPMPSDIGDALAQALIWESPAEAVLLFLATVPVAALAEEMLFRGFIQSSLERTGTRGNAVFISALLFAILHGNPWWFPQILLMGIILGFIAGLTDSIWPAVAAHAMFNLAGLLLANAAEVSALWYTEGGHVSPLLIITGACASWLGFVRLRGGLRKREINGQTPY